MSEFKPSRGLNRFLNALDSMRRVVGRQRTLRVRTRFLQPNHVQVAIEDKRAGIETNPDERLFQPFYTTKAEGLRLGLAISRWIVQTNGGKLKAISNNPHGAGFQFRLPLQTQ
ncbi:MAG: nodV1 [Verrucomicrobiales bacterium]|nr:nodV1 [Verrucomicrobiales bacterium]